jgi:ATP-dependent DNA helicase RecQ
MSSLEILQSTFGYHDFREGQREIIDAVLSQQDVFAVMPTGSGKSMCYQLPPLVDGGLTLVVSPLLALMRDQVKDLQRLGIAAASLNSMTTRSESDEIWQSLESRQLRLLFVSPERLNMNGMAEKLGRCGVSRMAIDEAHCISQWGHDFRMEYRQLPAIRERLGGVPVLALTATADKATRADIVKALFQTEPLTFIHSFDRPNLSLAFMPKEQPKRQITDFLKRQGNVSGIIYCNGREQTERLADYLKEQGFDAMPYHAGMDQARRNKHQDRFLQDDRVIMVATIAFGMGVNKPDVRFVVHADMPSSIESYYQEIGRAGRDGLPSATLTLYGSEDMAFARRRILQKEVSEEQRHIELKRLQSMIDLCENALCRRGAVLTYFGEGKSACQSCDLCGSEVKRVDETVNARKLFSAIWRTRQRFGAHYLADILTGNVTDIITRNQHDQLPTFGIGKDQQRGWWLTFVRKCFAAGLLEETEGERPGFQITQDGEAVLKGAQTFMMRDDSRMMKMRSKRVKPSERRIAPASDLDDQDQSLFEALKQLRRSLAAEEGVAAFMIFADRSLMDMVNLKPATHEQFAMVNGVGQKKREAYAEAFLAVIERELR